MKKIFLLILTAGLFFPLAGEEGVWVFEPFFTRLEDGTLILPDKAYSGALCRNGGAQFYRRLSGPDTGRR